MNLFFLHYHVGFFDVDEDAVLLDEVFEVILGDFALVDGRDLIHKVGQLTLQLLRRVRLVDVLGDLFLQVAGQVQVEHGRVGQV